MKILVGRILKPQGLKGEVKVECYLDDSAMLKNVKQLWLGISLFKVNGVRSDGQFCYIEFEGISTRESAESYKNWQVFALKEDIPLKEDSYFVDDLYDCEVYLDDGSFIGSVCDISQYGAADVYTTENQGKQVSFPWLKDLIDNVNISSKRITLKKQRFLEVAVFLDED